MHFPDHSSVVTLAEVFCSLLMNKISITCSSFPSGSFPSVTSPPHSRTETQFYCCRWGRGASSWFCNESSDLAKQKQTNKQTKTAKTALTFRLHWTDNIKSQLITMKDSSFHISRLLIFTPLLENPTLDKDKMVNYCLVLNLRFRPRLLEKVITNQFNSPINCRKKN